jgi:hypothetical protein
MNKLTPNNQVKLQNIIQYYTEYRKTHYDNNISIEIENKNRKEKQDEIDKQLQKIENIKKTEQYVLLNDEKCKMNKQIEIYEDNIDEIRNTYEEYKHYEDIMNDTEDVKNICEKIEILYNIIETIEHKQLDIIKKNGIDTELLEKNNARIKINK